MNVCVVVTECASYPESGVITCVGDAATERARCHVEKLRTSVAADCRAAATTADASQAPTVPSHHQSVHEASVGCKELAEFGPIIPFRVFLDTKRITERWVSDGGIELIDPVVARAVDCPVRFGGQPAQDVFKMGGVLSHSTTAAHQVKRVSILLVVPWSDGTWWCGAPVVRVPHAEVVAEFVAESAH